MYLERSPGFDKKGVMGWTKMHLRVFSNVKANAHKQTNVNRIIQGAHGQQNGRQDIWGGGEGEGHIKHNITMTTNKAPLYPPPAL